MRRHAVSPFSYTQEMYCVQYTAFATIGQIVYARRLNNFFMLGVLNTLSFPQCSSRLYRLLRPKEWYILINIRQIPKYLRYWNIFIVLWLSLFGSVSFCHLVYWFLFHFFIFLSLDQPSAVNGEEIIRYN